MMRSHTTSTLSSIRVAFFSQSVVDRSVRAPTASMYTDQQQRLGRPVSPHVTIYRQAIPAISSIMNRVSGISLALGFGGASAAAALGGDVPSLIWTALHATPTSVPLAKFVVAYPLVYHWISGVRHQFWSVYPENITQDFGQRSSLVLIASALVLSGVASCVTLSAPATKPSVAN